MDTIKKWTLSFALFLCAISASAQYDIDQFFFRGRQLLIDGKYASAIDNFNILVQLDSTLYDAYYFRGIAKYNLGDFMGAEKDFDKAMGYLKSSAEHGSKYAEQLYQNAHSNRNWSAGIGAFRLFHHLARIIQNRIEDEKSSNAPALNMSGWTDTKRYPSGVICGFISTRKQVATR